MLLSAEHISIHYGVKELVRDACVYLEPGDKIGVIGVNGTGKSTLLRCLAGQEIPDSGTVTRFPNVQGVFLPQNPPMDDTCTVLEQVFASQDAAYREIHQYEAVSMLNKLGIDDPQARVGTLSGGQRKRAALAAALLQPADVLILDEPTNHLDAEMVAWLEQKLISFPGAVLMVTHDRYFLERVATRIAELSRGHLSYFEANYSRYLGLKAQREEMAEASERTRQSILRREYQWIIRGCQARTTKSKERIDRYEALKNQQAPQYDDTVQMSAISSRLGRQILNLEHVSKAFGEKQVLRDFSYRLTREDRIGIVGRNGAGKSTLLNLMAGLLTPDEGLVETGATVKIGYFTQEARELDPNQTVWQLIHDVASEVRTGEGTFSAGQMLERFLFPPAVQHTAIGRLSGGERRRLYLLSILMSAPNVLLLDEPTNDLDLTTLSILEDYLESFSGPVLAVSHDRYFLDRVAEQIFEVRPGGEVVRYTGNYGDYLKKRLPPEPEKAKPAAPKAPPRPKQQKLKFSYKEQREFETIDADIAALEEQIARCDEAIANSGADFAALQTAMEEKERLSAQLDEKTDRWVYLNDLAEQIAGQ